MSEDRTPDYRKYESEKRVIAETACNHEEYERRIKELAQELKI
ncbi:MAG: hypothetical protein RBT80_26290 [Candidatus Vecturithrix sp.]|jgi:hypothetical protein|nr:hypothetical protein [Candidatus Vecturithrix sp.]